MVICNGKKIDKSASVKIPVTAPMLILGDPDQAFRLSFYPNKGIGLMRLGSSSTTRSVFIRWHWLNTMNWLTKKGQRKEIDILTLHYPDKKLFLSTSFRKQLPQSRLHFIRRRWLYAWAISKRMNIQTWLGKQFEPEENPMLGFRSFKILPWKVSGRFSSRMYGDEKVREEMGFTNVKLMIPFCRTVEEGRKSR